MQKSFLTVIDSSRALGHARGKKWIEAPGSPVLHRRITRLPQQPRGEGPREVTVALAGLSTPAGPFDLQRGLRQSLWALAQGATREVQRGYAESESCFGLGDHREGEALVQRLSGRVFEHDCTKQREFC